MLSAINPSANSDKNVDGLKSVFSSSSRDESTKHGAASLLGLFLTQIMNLCSKRAASYEGQLVQIEKPLEGRVSGRAIRWGWKLPLPLNFKCLSHQTFEKDTASEHLHLFFGHFVRLGPTLAIQSNSESNTVQESALAVFAGSRHISTDNSGSCTHWWKSM